MAIAWDVRGFQISGLPGWAWSEKYDVIAQTDSSPSAERFRSMLQMMLADRFQVQLHSETRQMKGYALVQDKRAKPLKLHEGECGPNSGKRGEVCGGFAINPASLDGVRVDMKQLASTLAQQRDVGRPVVDKTGISGLFDLHLQWTSSSPISPAGQLPATVADDSGSIFTALQEQLGLRLDSESVATEILAVDRAERPSAN
jgi:uncharacterized protein (TIGR03435 family)